jgi:hypothetical protein
VIMNHFHIEYICFLFQTAITIKNLECRHSTFRILTVDTGRLNQFIIKQQSHFFYRRLFIKMWFLEHTKNCDKIFKKENMPMCRVEFL